MDNMPAALSELQELSILSRDNPAIGSGGTPAARLSRSNAPMSPRK